MGKRLFLDVERLSDLTPDQMTAVMGAGVITQTCSCDCTNYVTDTVTNYCTATITAIKIESNGC